MVIILTYILELFEYMACDCVLSIYYVCIQCREELLELDELTREILAGRVLCGFKALTPNFPPTFKVTSYASICVCFMLQFNMNTIAIKKVWTGSDRL
jgi:hypothetical protein